MPAKASSKGQVIWTSAKLERKGDISVRIQLESRNCLIDSCQSGQVDNGTTTM